MGIWAESFLFRFYFSSFILPWQRIGKENSEVSIVSLWRRNRRLMAGGQHIKTNHMQRWRQKIAIKYTVQLGKNHGDTKETHTHTQISTLKRNVVNVSTKANDTNVKSEKFYFRQSEKIQQADVQRGNILTSIHIYNTYIFYIRNCLRQIATWLFSSIFDIFSIGQVTFHGTWICENRRKSCHMCMLLEFSSNCTTDGYKNQS